MNVPIEEYIRTRYTINDRGCWIWKLRVESKGYGQVWHSDFYGDMAHRVSYLVHVGPIPPDLQLDHLCRVKNCINPDHLEPVTNAENMRRRFALNLCLKGHKLEEGNLVVFSGTRRCKICYDASQKVCAARKLAKSGKRM
jgi:hypothetical protein